MASISTTDIIVAVGVLGTVAVALVYAIFRLRRQRERLKRDIANGATPTEDRAFNQLAFSRSEVTVLEREGFDVRVPRAMLDDAQAQLDRRDFGASLKQSKAAHDAMVRLRAAGPNAAALPEESLDTGPDSSGRSLRSSTRGSSPPGAASTAVGAAAGAASSAGVSSRPPPNRSEAHFQLNLLAGELEALRAKRPNDPRLSEGDQLFRSAQTAYQSGQYTEALRLGLRGRRAIGTQVESLPPPAKTEPASPNPGEGQARCGQCGTASRGGDQFCRKCGASLKVGSCPRCGNRLHDGDRFCGVCGAPTVG